jgi:nucleoside-diphosphate-sugar epimerase
MSPLGPSQPGGGCLRGSFKRDFLYVKDLIGAYMAMLEGLEDPKTHGQAFNFAIGGSWTVLEIVQKLQALLCREHIQPHIVLKEHTEILAQHMSFNKAQQMLHWSPRFSLDQSLQETVEWYCDFFASHPHYVNPSVYSMWADRSYQFKPVSLHWRRTGGNAPG